MGSRFRPSTYRRPNDIDEALSLLAAHGSKARILAGGTDLLTQRPPAVEVLVDIRSLDLDFVGEDKGKALEIGAATRVEALENVEALSTAPYRALSEAADAMATPTIRNMATIGGNLCNASPGGDLSVALTALGAVVSAAGPGGRMEIPIAEFFAGPNATTLQENEMVLKILIPPLSDKTGSSFCKLRHHQTSVDTAVVNVATRLHLVGGLCVGAAVSMGAVGPVPLRARGAESLLIGKAPGKEIVEQASRLAMEESMPVDDIRASADYRKRMVGVLVKRSLETSLRRCGA